MEQLAYAFENAIAYVQAHPKGCLIMAIAAVVVSVLAYFIRRAERELNNPTRPIHHEILEEIHNN